MHASPHAQVKWSALILALPGVIVAIGLTAVLVFCIFNLAARDPMSLYIGWSESFLMASILSATDPVAVVSVLHTLGAPAKLSILISGESLLNDGSAYVFFVVFKELSSAICRDDPYR